MKGFLRNRRNSPSNVSYFNTGKKLQNKIQLKLCTRAARLKGKFPIPKLLHSVLHWTSLIESSKNTIWNRTTSVIFGILLHFACFNVWYIAETHFQAKLIKVGLSYLISYSLTVVIWYTTIYKRKHLKNLLENIKDIKSFPGEKIINLFVSLLCTIPIALSTVEASSLNNSKEGKMYTYGNNTGNDLMNVLFYMQIILYYVIYPTYTNIMALLYGTLCLRCFVHINVLSTEVVHCSPKTFGLPKQLDILKRKAKIKEILIIIQDLFSLPILLIIISNAAMCGSATGYLLTESWNETFMAMKIEVAYYGINAFVCVVSILWVAGALPIEMNKFKETFHSKTHSRLLYYHTKDELYLKREVVNEPDFVLTGCEIISYKRSTVLAFVGTLLTYTVLVISID
ncbi:uncharacterized protein TNCT_3401 [Trichonephila clavata]|uniref:Gustatory receptor n=1 Tax=Trichonephila clavata TaxID=2740835 RepID=A0A8X6H8F1_TRICU|nr:uncharacterized protein TNCT_3401 [Trichonephila clavata]